MANIQRQTDFVKQLLGTLNLPSQSKEVITCSYIDDPEEEENQECVCVEPTDDTLDWECTCWKVNYETGTETESISAWVRNPETGELKGITPHNFNIEFENPYIQGDIGDQDKVYSHLTSSKDGSWIGWDSESCSKVRFYLISL